MQDSLVLHRAIEEYPITNSWKTVARLERGGQFPSVGAMSGWSHSPIQSLRVGGRQWINDVLHISKLVGHVLPSHIHDHGQDGAFYACHAEKQLIAYFIDRHVFLPPDCCPDSRLQNEFYKAEDELGRFLSEDEIGREIQTLRKRKQDLEDELFDGDEKLVGKDDEIKALESDLRSVQKSLNRITTTDKAKECLKLESNIKILNGRLARQNDLVDMASAPPPASLLEAVIFISSMPCENCIAFKNKVNSFFELSLQFFAAV